MDYFPDANTTLDNLLSRVGALEMNANQAILDRLATLEDENVALKFRVQSAEDALVKHEGRLDAISTGAAG